HVAVRAQEGEMYQRPRPLAPEPYERRVLFAELRVERDNGGPVLARIRTLLHLREQRASAGMVATEPLHGGHVPQHAYVVSRSHLPRSENVGVSIGATSLFRELGPLARPRPRLPWLELEDWLSLHHGFIQVWPRPLDEVQRGSLHAER